jgi:phosphate transport system substrate-binding protein
MKLKLFIITLTLSITTSFIPTAHATDLKGAGSTFSANFIDKCRVMYAQQTGNILNYTPNGSGAGRNFFNNKIVDFAVSDTPYSSLDRKPTDEFLYVPVVAGPIAVVYNLKGYNIKIKLTKETLAKIFAGQITMWNDPEIQKLNIGKLPKTKITVVYRVDGSGTSEVFTSYLNAVAPHIWTKPGNKTFSSAFPGNINSYIGGFQSASGSTQVSVVQSTINGSISYNEVSYVGKFKAASIENEAGKFMSPTSSAAAAFLSNLKFNADGSTYLDYKNPNKLSYNISTFAYAVAYTNSKEKAVIIREFLTYAITKCNKIDGYAPITGNALKVAKLQIAKIK